MEAAEKFVTSLQLHPVADHFTIAILTVAILSDLAARFAPQRLWIGKMALTLTVIGAIAAAASFLTGDVETDRVWDMLSPATKVFFDPKGAITRYFGHGALGYELMIAFGVLAFWRILIGAFSFMESTHSAYLLAGLIALGLLFYQAKTGGELVYKYQVGTGSMEPGTVTPGVAGPTGIPSGGAFNASPQETPVFSATLTPVSTPTLASPAVNFTPTPIVASPTGVATPTSVMVSPGEMATPTSTLTGVPSPNSTPVPHFTTNSGNSLGGAPNAASTASL
jgi:uncharacterized membrane protein